MTSGGRKQFGWRQEVLGMNNGGVSLPGCVHNGRV